MIIDFEHMEEKKVEGFRSGSGVLSMRAFDDGRAKIMLLTLAPGAQVGAHAHEGDCEIVYVLSGTGKAMYEGGYETLTPGTCHYCPEGKHHCVINDSDGELTFFAVVPSFKK